MSLQRYALQAWYKKNILTWVLWPLSQLFKGIVFIRKYLCQNPATPNVPIIVVGNLTVGGTGKTPMVIALAQALRQQGFCPAIITRGYGARKTIRKSLLLTGLESAADVSDEALLLKLKSDCPVMVGANRLASIKILQQKCPQVDLIISDDGLQHYKMPRTVEIVMAGERLWGNGFCLPAGPLREPLSRLKSVDYVIYSDAHNQHSWFVEKRLSAFCYHLYTQESRALDTFQQQHVHAVAALANPQPFFDMLRQKQLYVIAHVFADHYRYQNEDFYFNDDLPILITEKDAVKCRDLALNNVWVVPLETTLQNTMIESLVRKLSHGQKTPRYSGVPSLQARTDLQERTAGTDL